MVVPNLGLLQSGATELNVLEGGVVITNFASRANLHMATFGTTKEQLAMVAVKNRRHASMNPLAQFRDTITVEDVLNAPMMADPLTKLSCCPNADGGAAVVLCAAELSNRFTAKPIHIEASVLVSGIYDQMPDLVRFEEDQRASSIAYEMAGLGPKDLDVVECHDAFTICEIMHPLGATAVAQIVEGVRQLRGEAGDRQVEGAKVYLAECMGAEKYGDAKTCTVIILQK